MAHETIPSPDEELFDLSNKPQDDADVPRHLLAEERERVAALPVYHWLYGRKHPDAPDPENRPVDTAILDAFEWFTAGIIARQDSKQGYKVNPQERAFLKEFLGISGRTHYRDIRKRYGLRREYLSTLQHADQSGSTIAEATNDIAAGRAPLLPGLFHNQALLAELHHRIAAGDYPSLQRGGTSLDTPI